jgi:enoyl-CoA hydratase/carnithine racemase
MEYKHLKVTVTDKVATVLIDRPDKGNSLSPAVLTEMEAVFTELDGKEGIHVIVFTGGERYFSAGFDLDEIRKLRKDANEAFTALFHRAYRAILYCSQPVICAVGGPAIAGGFDLTMMCDIRYASERAKFGQREIALSLTPIMDPLWRIVGLGRAKEVALTGRIYDAHEAERMGYVSRVFAEGELLSSVSRIARDMASFDQACLQETKQLGNSVLDQGLDGAMRIQEWLFRSYIGSEENHRRIDELRAQLAARQKK